MIYVLIVLVVLAGAIAATVRWFKRSNELWRGYNRALEIIQSRCPYCDGWGYYGVAFQGPKCVECGGTGTLTREQRDALTSRANDERNEANAQRAVVISGGAVSRAKDEPA